MSLPCHGLEFFRQPDHHDRGGSAAVSVDISCHHCRDPLTCRPPHPPHPDAQMTMFIAFFAFTERRIALGYRDFCCCPPCARKPLLMAPIPATSSPSEIISIAHVQVAPPGVVQAEHDAPGKPDLDASAEEEEGMSGQQSEVITAAEGKGSHGAASGINGVVGDADAAGQATAAALVQENWVKYLFRVYCESGASNGTSKVAAWAHQLFAKSLPGPSPF